MVLVLAPSKTVSTSVFLVEIMILMRVMMMAMMVMMVVAVMVIMLIDDNGEDVVRSDDIGGSDGNNVDR